MYITWYSELIALTIQSHFAKLLGPFSVEAVPLAIINPCMRHSNLDMTSAHIDMQIQVALIQLQSKEMARLKQGSIKEESK